jgi:hypothetical protein
MRKKSKYKPRGVIQNPLAYVMEGMMPLKQHTSMSLVDMKNHGAMYDLIRGQATRAQMDLLVMMHNICEALFRMGFGTDYKDCIQKGGKALYDVCCRGATTKKFVCKSEEIPLLNDLMDLHDAQLEVITVKDMEKAVAIVKAELQQKKAIVISDRSQSNVKTVQPELAVSTVRP